MIEDPGSFSGNNNSPRPERGPDASKRISLPIFNNDIAREFRVDEKLTRESCAAIDSNLFFAGKYLYLVCCDKYLQKILSKFLGELIPVPTAVPPCAKKESSFKASNILFLLFINCSR